jgi:hypothetical protein
MIINKKYQHFQILEIGTHNDTDISTGCSSNEYRKVVYFSHICAGVARQCVMQISHEVVTIRNGKRHERTSKNESYWMHANADAQNLPSRWTLLCPQGVPDAATVRFCGSRGNKYLAWDIMNLFLVCLNGSYRALNKYKVKKEWNEIKRRNKLPSVNLHNFTESLAYWWARSRCNFEWNIRSQSRDLPD